MVQRNRYQQKIDLAAQDDVTGLRLVQAGAKTFLYRYAHQENISRAADFAPANQTFYLPRARFSG